MPVNYPAKGHAGIVEATFVQQFWLDAGGQPIYCPLVVAAGQVLAANSVMGIVTATGEAVLCDPAAGDGSEQPYAILQENLDTTAAADEVSLITFSNRTINFNALVHHTAWDKKLLSRALSLRGIATRTPMYSAL